MIKTISLYENWHLYFLGAYTPLTREGNIIVDGILASCYASTDHDLGHLVMKPLHWFPEIVEWIFGNKNKISAYAEIMTELGKYMMPNQ